MASLSSPRVSVSLNEFKRKEFPDQNAQEIISKLYLGSARAAYDQRSMKHHCITHILACHGRPPIFQDDFHYLVLYLNDNDGEQDLTSYFKESNAFIEDALANGGSVLVHCVRGVSRSAIMVIAYLISKGYSLEDSLRWVKSGRRQAQPRSGFLKQLKAFEMFVNLTMNPPTSMTSISDSSNSCGSKEKSIINLFTTNHSLNYIKPLRTEPKKSNSIKYKEYCDKIY